MWGKLQELREALVDFRSSGKPLVALLEFAGDREYVLASAASRVVLVPPGQLNLVGLASYQVFLRGTFDLIGAKPDLLHIGDYKTAVNTFTEKGFTPAHKEMTESLNRDAFEQLLGMVASARKKSVEDVRVLVDQGPMLPEAALQNGLVDDVAYFDEMGKTSGLGDGSRNCRSSSTSPSCRPRGRASARRASPSSMPSARLSRETAAAVPTGIEVGSDKLTRYIRDVRNDDSIKAVVLRVDSPGGSTVASDVIWRELMLLRARKPLVVSMSDLAASGGYYIAMPGHVIVAQPGTLTGSIGIFSGKFVTGGTYNKLGMNIEAVSSGAYAEMYSPNRPFNPAERAKIEEQMQAFYDQFVEKVGRIAFLDAGEDRRHRAGSGLDWPAGARAWARGRTGRIAARAGHRAAARWTRQGRGGPGGDLPAQAERLRGVVDDLRRRPGHARLACRSAPQSAGSRGARDHSPPDADAAARRVPRAAAVGVRAIGSGSRIGHRGSSDCGSIGHRTNAKRAGA